MRKIFFKTVPYSALVSLIFIIFAYLNLKLSGTPIHGEFFVIPMILGAITGFTLGYFFNRYREEQANKYKALKEKEQELQMINSNLEVIISQKTNDLNQKKEELEKLVKNLKEKEFELNKYRVLISQSPASIVITDTEGNIEYVNPKFEEITGYQLEEVIGKNPRILKSGHQDELFYKNLWDTITNGKTWRGEFLNKKKNGELYWESAIISPVKDESGNIIQYFAIKDDITLLKESQKKYSSIVRAAKDAIIMVNNEGKVSLWNKSAEDLFGYKEDEIIGKDLHKLLANPEDYIKFREAFKIFRENGKGNAVGKTVVVEGIKKNGTSVPVELSLSAFKIREKWHAIGIVRDFTERLRLEEEIKAERDKAQMYLDIAGAFIVELDLKGNVVLINKTGCEILGYKKEEIIGKNWFDNFLPEDIRDNVKKIFFDYINDKVELPEYYENSILTKDGKQRIILWHNSDLVDKKGRKIGALSAGMDINEIKKLERKLEKRNKELEEYNKKIEEYSEKINEQYIKLFQSQNELKEANATKDKFFSILAHDLRGPLGTSKQLMDMILGTFSNMTDEEKLDLLSEINKSLTNIYHLLEELLSWSRSQRGVLPFEPQNLDIKFIIESVFSLLKSNADNKKIKLLSDVPDSTFVYADPNMLTTIIRNLVSNAIKFTPEDGEITVSAYRYDKDPNFICISVKDTGVGISKDNISKLFKIGQNFTTLGTNQEKGTGLGLILVKEFVEKHGGRIWVESELDKGTTFSFTVPMAK